MTDPGYTLVIPAWNAAATIGEAIASALGQERPPARVIVVDDGSTDATAAAAQAAGPRVEVVTQRNAGPGAATSRGLARVTTPLVATLDADDLWLPGKAARQLALLQADPALDAVFTLTRQVAAAPDHPGHGVVAPGWTRTTLMMRTALFARFGAIEDPPGRRGEMVDWLARLRAGGARLQLIDEVLALRRIRAGSLSCGRDPARDRGYLHAARAAILRRRAGAAPDE